MRPMLLRPRNFNEEKPTGADIDPDTGYLWWWEEWSNAWRLCDPSWCDTYKWWLPYNAIPDPDEYHFNEDYKKLVKEQSKKCAEYMEANNVQNPWA